MLTKVRGGAEGVGSLLDFIYCAQKVILNSLKTAASPYTHIPNTHISPNRKIKEKNRLAFSNRFSLSHCVYPCYTFKLVPT